MGLACILILLTLPLGIFLLASNASRLKTSSGTFIMHSGMNFTFTFPAVIWRQNTTGTIILIEYTRWIFIFAAISFVALFGLDEEARTHYRKMLTNGMRVFRQPTWTTLSGSVQASRFVGSKKARRMDPGTSSSRTAKGASVGSFGSVLTFYDAAKGIDVLHSPSSMAFYENATQRV